MNWENFRVIISQEVLTKVTISASLCIKDSHQQVELLNNETTRDLSLRFDMNSDPITSKRQFKISDIDNAIFSSFIMNNQS